jgi:hypothetical protein
LGAGGAEDAKGATVAARGFDDDTGRRLARRADDGPAGAAGATERSRAPSRPDARTPARAHEAGGEQKAVSQSSIAELTGCVRRKQQLCRRFKFLSNSIAAPETSQDAGYLETFSKRAVPVWFELAL